MTTSGSHSYKYRSELMIAKYQQTSNEFYPKLDASWWMQIFSKGINSSPPWPSVYSLRPGLFAFLELSVTTNIDGKLPKYPYRCRAGCSGKLMAVGEAEGSYRKRHFTYWGQQPFFTILLRQGWVNGHEQLLDGPMTEPPFICLLCLSIFYWFFLSDTLALCGYHVRMTI